MEKEDPVDYLEKCNEYLTVWPMSDNEILASLPSVLTHTAKDWWVAVKVQVKLWNQFKTFFFFFCSHSSQTIMRLRQKGEFVNKNKEWMKASEPLPFSTGLCV